MLELDRELFDEYKRLDSICRDMFSSQRGVSEYIDRMDQTPVYIRAEVYSWEDDYRTLKRLRWLRNQIAHEMYASDCGVDDIVRLRDFYDRILRQQDPLAVLRRAEQAQQRRSSQVCAAERPQTRAVIQNDIPKRIPQSSSNKERKTLRGVVAFLLELVIVALLLAFIVYSVK